MIYVDIDICYILHTDLLQELINIKSLRIILSFVRACWPDPELVVLLTERILQFKGKDKQLNVEKMMFDYKEFEERTLNKYNFCNF